MGVGLRLQQHPGETPHNSPGYFPSHRGRRGFPGANTALGFQPPQSNFLPEGPTFSVFSSAEALLLSPQESYLQC